MPLADDRYLPQLDGADTIFTDILNCELESKPTRTGFFTGEMFFRKRDGIKDTTLAAGAYDIQYALQDNDILWAYTDHAPYKITPTTSTLLKSGLVYDSRVLRNILNVKYLGGGMYKDGSVTSFQVLSYIADETTVLFPKGPGHVLDSTIINKFMYVNTGSGFGQHVMVKNFLEESTDYKVTIDFSFPAFMAGSVQVATPPDSKSYVQSYVTFYNKDDANQIWFPALKKNGTTDLDGSDVRFYAYDQTAGLTGTDMDLYWNFPKIKKILFRNNYPITLSADGKTISVFSSLNYEFLNGLNGSVTPLNLEASNIDVYGGYLFVFFPEKIGIVKNDTITTSTGVDTAFKYQDGINTGVYSKYAYSVEGDQMYFVGNDRAFYSMAIDVKSNGNVVLDPSNQGDTIYNFLRALVGGEITIYNKGSILRIVHQTGLPTLGLTSVYKYYINYKLWLRDEFRKGGNFYNFYCNINGGWYTCLGERLVLFSGRKDLDVKIRQYILMYGPENGKYSECSVLQIKLRIGLTAEPIAGTLKFTINGSENTIVQRDLTQLGVINNLNLIINSNGTMGTTIMGTLPLGGFADDAQMQEFIALVFPEIITMSAFVGKRGHNFKIEIENDGFDQLYFGGLIVQYNPMNPVLIANSMVLN